MTTYHGRCHCGAIQFAFRSEPIHRGVRCNCSICVRKSAVMSVEYLPFDELTGHDRLARYRFGDNLVNHYFCSHCGIYPFHDTALKPGLYRVNLGCVEGIDPLALPVETIDGRAF